MKSKSHEEIQRLKHGGIDIYSCDFLIKIQQANKQKKISS